MFSALNYKLFAVSIALLILGYILLGQGPASNPLSLSVAPAILVAVYLVLLPVAIIVKGKEEKKKS
jgi:hypothetical protein